MAKDIWSVCSLVENYKSTYNGIDWTDPKNNAWSNFPWQDLSVSEKKYIKTLWNYWNNQGDAGKLIFFDIINLAPTVGENYGYQIKEILNERKDFFVNVPIPIDAKTKKPAYKYVPFGIFKQLQSQQKNADGKKTESQIQDIIRNKIEIDEDDILHPVESEFKLTWMRDLVERGIEGVMGPFVASLKSDGSPNKTTDGRVISKIDKNSLDRFINNRTDYKEAIWQDWLQGQLDFATKNPTDYNNSPYPKVSLKDLQTLSKGEKLSEDGKEQFVMTEAISGQLTSNTKGKDVFQKLALGANKQPIFRDGVMAKVNPNYTISGWIKIPEIYGDRQLPWPFVWRYIGREGIMQRTVWESSGRPEFINPELSVVKIVDKLAIQQNKSNVPNHVPYVVSGTSPSYSFLAYDVRSRFWHHKYSTKEISARELLFLIRYKYGAAGAVGERFISDDNILNTDIARNEWDSIKQCGGVPKEGVNILRSDRGYDRVTVTYLPYEKNGNIYKLRSKYICQIHDTVGWNRFGGSFKGHVLPDTSNNRVDLGTPLKGEPFEIVDFNKQQGYYSFTGGTSDRQPIQEGQTDLTDDYSLYEYKRDFKLDVQKNHISLWRLLNSSESENPTGVLDGNDRFVTPDFIISTNEIKTIYHNHANDYLFNSRDAFYPGLYTNKELQFLYELVSYVFYGKTNTEFVERPSSAFGGVSAEIVNYSLFDRDYLDNLNYKHRWKELGSTISTNSSVFMMDYISWAAPTNEQYRKVKFSIADFDNFVKRYKEMLSTSGDNWTDEVIYPVHSFAKKIYESESSKIPTVPAWVHYKYISRTLNYGENGIGRELDDEDVYRVFGGKKDDIDTGKLIALPMFVLGGRPDIPNDEKWDSSWGNNPFKIENGFLTVGNMDDVLDNWAKQKLHNGKYVSAMEILFWLRYKRGLASAPTQRTIRYPINRDFEKINYKDTINSKNYWPKESFVFSEGGYYSTRSANRISLVLKTTDDGDILPTETLHNIPILTSHYHPIYSDGNSDEGVLYKNADPLMDFETEQKIKGMSETAYTGWNSKYVAYWNGARKVPENSLSTPRISAYFSEQYPIGMIGPIGTQRSKITQLHTKPFRKVHDFYIANQNGKKYDNSKGLLYGFSENKTIYTSDIQAWFRAIKILAIHDSYAKYISDGIIKNEGEIGSVIPVKAQISNNKNDNEPKSTIVFISGEPIGKRYSPSEDFTIENLLHRPWEGLFQKQPELDALLDDYSLGTKNCIPQYRYMRHIIQPVDFMYFFPKTKENTKAWYSDEQSYKTLKWMIRMIPTKSYTGFGVDVFDKMDKLSLRVLILGGSVSNTVGKNLLKTPIGKNITEVSTAIQRAYSGVWAAGKLGKIMWTISAISTKVKTIGAEYFKFIGQKEIYERSKLLEDYFKYKLDYPLTFAKWGLVFANELKQGKLDVGSALYFSKEGIIKYYGDVFKDISKHKFADEIEKILVREGTSARTLNLAKWASWANFGLTMLFELISWQVDLMIENYRAEDKINDMWELLNEATKNNWVEGPYMESKGTIRISKGSDGSIAGNYDPKELENQGIKNIPAQRTSSNNFWDSPVPAATNTTSLNDFINRHTEKFYKPNGLAETIGKNLKEGSCECQFLTSLFAETPTFKSDSNYNVQDLGTPFNRKNWQRGIFIRQWRNRERIIDDAPTYSDIPITFAKAERPRYDTKYLMDISSTQISDLQQPGGWNGVKGRATNIRVNGQGGTVAVSMADCPRFWWPNILHVAVSDDLCSYMAINGKYPSRMPEIYRMCDQNSAYQLESKIAKERNKTNQRFISESEPTETFFTGGPIRRYARSGVIPYSNINYQSVSSGPLHTEQGNNIENNVWLGNTIISLQGIDGIAPPHEREIVRLFRMKYGIDIVNPNNNCCSIGEVLDEGSNFAGELASRQDDATKCEYIIKLNDERFHKIVKNACVKNTTSDNSQENADKEISNNTTNGIRKADISQIDSSVISGSTVLSPDLSLVKGGWSDNKRRKKSRRKNPCIPGCVDCCDDDRPVLPGVEVSQRQIAIENADTTFANSPSANLNRYRIINETSGILASIGNAFGSIVGGALSYNIPSTPVEPFVDQETISRDSWERYKKEREIQKLKKKQGIPDTNQQPANQNPVGNFIPETFKNIG